MCITVNFTFHSLHNAVPIYAIGTIKTAKVMHMSQPYQHKFQWYSFNSTYLNVLPKRPLVIVIMNIKK